MTDWQWAVSCVGYPPCPPSNKVGHIPGLLLLTSCAALCFVPPALPSSLYPCLVVVMFPPLCLDYGIGL